MTVHGGLQQAPTTGPETILCGPLPFEAAPDGLAPITASFEIEMLIPEEYPEILPGVKETGGNIASEYEHVFAGGTLCLAVPIEMRRVFHRQPSLLGFVNNLVIPYFYGYCHWKEHGEHPFGEHKHGGEGVLEYYTDRLQLRDEDTAMAFVCFLHEHGYRGHHDCPCGSGRRLRKCHGPTLLDLHRHHTPLTLQHDLSWALDHYEKKFLREKQQYLPDKLAKQIHRILRRRNRRSAKR